MTVIRKSFEVEHHGSVDGLFAIFDKSRIAIIATAPGQRTPALCLENRELVSVREAASLFSDDKHHSKMSFFYAAVDEANFVGGESRPIIFMKASVQHSVSESGKTHWIEGDEVLANVSREFFPDEVQKSLKNDFEPMVWSLSEVDS